MFRVVMLRKNMMERLSDDIYPLPDDKMSRCQLCGTSYDDICEIRVWEEMGDEDESEHDPKFIVVGQKCCKHKIVDHPRLYKEVAWGLGRPGSFPLLCGPCKNRSQLRCLHPKTKQNGGEGLNVYFKNTFPGVTSSIHVQWSDGRSGYVDLVNASECEGLQTS